MIRFGVTMLALCLSFNAASAATLKVSAINGTSGLPAAGDQVLLLWAPPGNKLAELGRGKTDANGRFEFTVTDSAAPRMVRVIHQGVAYPRVAPAGVASVIVHVYDAAQQLDHITATGDIQRLQTSGDQLQVIEEISVRNASDPPRTEVGGFEMQLPRGAQVIAGRVRAGDGHAVESKPTARNQTGRYYFPVPLIPGDSHFGVAYVLPYPGEATIDPTFLYPLERLVVLVPKSMKFEAKTPGTFQPMANKADNVQEMVAVKTGRSLAFRVSGTGTLVPTKSAQQEGHGRTPLRNSPDASHKDLYVVGGLGLFVTTLVAGLLTHKRKQKPFSV